MARNKRPSRPKPPRGTGRDWQVPGDTRGGTDFSTVPQTPGIYVPPSGGNPGQINPAPAGNGMNWNSYGGNPAPAAPPPPPPPSPYNDPAPDKTYSDEMAGTQTSYENSMANIAAQRQRLGNDFGFDPVTGVASENVDVTNPFSRAAMLNRSFAQAQRSSTNNYANRGLLTSGAYGAAMGDDSRNYAQGMDSLTKSFAERLAEFRANEQDAEAAKSAANVQSYGALVSRRMQQDAPIPPENLPIPQAEKVDWAALVKAMSGASTPKKKPKGKKK